MNPLCDLADRFPTLAAQILERDRGKRRNFREESITDVLMASLVGLESFGIKVDFPDEPSTGADMDWEFVDSNPNSTGRYLRLYIQSKRAISNRSKKLERWYYRELDHASPISAGKGSQAQTLVSAAANEIACCPLYMFYHPESALKPAVHGLPAVEGVNIVHAKAVAKAVHGGCSIKTKLVDYWQPQFMSLSDILCWPVGMLATPQARFTQSSNQFLGIAGFWTRFSPSKLAMRLSEIKGAGPSILGEDSYRIVASDQIPASTLRAIQGEMTEEDRRSLQRPRAIFSNRSIRDVFR